MSSMSVMRIGRVAAVAAALTFVPVTSAFADDPPARSGPPLMAAYGPNALTIEGDHDHRLVVRFDVPADRRGTVHVRLFDPDTAGLHDEVFGRPDGRTRFSIYGADARVQFGPDDAGIYQEYVSGTPLVSREFGADRRLDDSWTTLASLDVGDGELFGNRRMFFLVVDGIDGNDGNLFDVAISASAAAQEAVTDARLYSYMPTVRVLNRRSITELGFAIPNGATSLTFINFDTAGGRIEYAGPFRSQPLDASNQDEWRMTRIALQPDEAGRRASVVLAGGTEIPNVISLVIVDDAGAPIPIALPPRSLPPNRRPVAVADHQPKSCERLAFDASQSSDADGGELAYRWLFHDGTMKTGPRVTHDYARPGTYPVRLEVRDGSGHIGNGARQEFKARVKPRPIARIDGPDEIAQDTTVAFDGRRSASPANLTLAAYSWRVDGKPAGSDPLLLRYFAHPGPHAVDLTVVEDTDHPCKSATISATVDVDAKPVARAGDDRTIEAGELFVLDGGGSTDADGNVVSYRWKLPDGRTDTRPRFRYALFTPGTHRFGLTVTDDSGFKTNVASDRIVVTVAPKKNVPPRADAGTTLEATVGDVVTFDAGASADEDGTLISYHWDYDDDIGGEGIRAYHSFPEPGIYDIRLTVVDDSGAENDVAWSTRRVTVSPRENALPIVGLPKSTAGFVDEPLTFDAGSARDPDGNVVSYHWDFGDGTSANGMRVEHTYQATGTYTAVLTLRDNSNGLTDFSTHEVAVDIAARGNQPPIANAGTGRTVRVGDRVDFDGGASRDPDGSISRYDWQFGDGFASNGVRTSHIYQQPGRYTVSLTVTDNAPADPGRSRGDIVVTVEPRPNAPPSAAAGPDRTVRVGEPITFDASASRDPDGNILAYEWSFGDGRRAVGRHPVHAYHRAGKYRVTLRVTDDGGDGDGAARTAEDIVTVVVAGGPGGSGKGGAE